MTTLNHSSTDLELESKLFNPGFGFSIVLGVPAPGSLGCGHGCESQVRRQAVVASQLVDLLTTHQQSVLACRRKTEVKYIVALFTAPITSSYHCCWMASVLTSIPGSTSTGLSICMWLTAFTNKSNASNIFTPKKFVITILNQWSWSENYKDKYIFNRNETIWRYIDTVSIRRLTIRIVAQRDTTLTLIL